MESSSKQLKLLSLFSHPYVNHFFSTEHKNSVFWKLGYYELLLYGKIIEIDKQWVNNDRIFIFQWTMPLTSEKK